MFSDPYGKDWYENTTNGLDDRLIIEDVLSQRFKNPLEDEPDLYITCPTCGEHLHDGETYYPEIGVCEYCISDYKQTVSINL